MYGRHAGPVGRASRGRRGAVALAGRIALLVSVVGAIGAVNASPASAERTIEAESATKGRFVPGHGAAVVVTVASDTLLSGSVRVQTRDAEMGMPSPGPVEVPIEVAGGTTKELVVVVPTSRLNRNGDMESRTQDLTVELVDGGVVVADDLVELSARNWEEVAGVLPGLAGTGEGELPESAALRFRSGDALLVPVDQRLLAAGGAALGAFSTIAALPSDIGALQGAERAALIEWITGGGHLLVDGAVGADIEGLPSEWQPTGGWSTAGAGDIRLTGGRLQQGSWDGIIDPTEGGVVPSNQANVPTAPGYTTAGTLGVDAGFRIPQLNALLIALSIYVLLVGPVTFILLGRLRRRPLAWLAVPAIAGVFTAVFAVTGAQLRNDTDAAHATVIEIAPTGARASTSTLVGSISGGTVALVHPEGWAIDRPDAALNWGNPWGGGNPAAAAVTPALLSRPGGSEATMNLDPGEFVLVESNGPAPLFDDALVVDARADGTTVTGTVRNNLAVALTEVSVLIGYASTSLDTLGPGEERSFTIDNARSIADAPFPEYHEWSVPPPENQNVMMNGGRAFDVACGPNGCMDMNGFGGANPPVEPDSPVNPAAWSQYLGERGDALRSLDSVSVVGWSNEVDSPLTTGDGRAVERGRTALVARAPVSVTALDSVGVRAQAVREVDFRKVEVGFDDAIVNGTLYRIMLPTQIGGQPLDPTSVSIRFPAHLRSVLVWNDDSYTVVPEPGAGERIVYRLAPDDVAAGVVFVRIRLQDQLNTPANMMPPGLQGSGWGLNAGWEVFSGSVADVTDTANERIATNGGGGFNGGMGVPGTVVLPPMPTTTAVVAEPPVEVPVPIEVGP